MVVGVGKGLTVRFDLITIFPEMLTTMDYGIVGRAKSGELIDLVGWNPRDYTEDRRRRVDDASYGGGPGMVMMVEPLRRAIGAARQANPTAQLVYLTPQGELLNHRVVGELVAQSGLILVCGRYEGVDERLMALEPGREISIGDYVLSGGELAALVVVDAVTRQLPGVVGDQESVQQDSFVAGILDYPHYTRPEQIAGMAVPEVLLSGNHAVIERWRRKQALGRTWQRRPALIINDELTDVDRMLLNEFIKETS